MEDFEGNIIPFKSCIKIPLPAQFAYSRFSFFSQNTDARLSPLTSFDSWQFFRISKGGLQLVQITQNRSYRGKFCWNKVWKKYAWKKKYSLASLQTASKRFRYFQKIKKTAHTYFLQKFIMKTLISLSSSTHTNKIYDFFFGHNI